MLHMFVNVFVTCCAFTISNVVTQTTLDLGTDHKSGFSRVTVVKTVLYHTRTNREIQTTNTYQDGLVHLEDVTVSLDIGGQRRLLDLTINRDLFPIGYFERHQSEGSHSVRTPSHKEIEHCHYQGRLRGVPNSWAAISTCHGLSGTMFDGEEVYHLEPTLGEDHHLYSHADLLTNYTCDTKGDNSTYFHWLTEKIRRKRSSILHEPCGSDDQSKYVELVLVADQSLLNSYDSKVIFRLQELANIVNNLYKPLNIFVALVGVVLWTKRDEILINSDSLQVLIDFLEYRKVSLLADHPNDNAHLITKIAFKDSVVGRAYVGTMCSPDVSGGVTHDYSSVAGVVAATLAHEMGHNFNMDHDSNECHCPTGNCIMGASSSSSKRTKWSSCSKKYLKEGFEKGIDICLFNKPRRLIGDSKCGNGWLEEGEECDCDNICCNNTTCRFAQNATCAAGACCDLQSCQLKTAGTECRQKRHECDLPEYCTGEVGFCPEDVFLSNGIPCKNGQSYCYNGTCKSHDDQCRALWGPKVKNGVWDCYDFNIKGDGYGNCGRDQQQAYLKCDIQDQKCGRLQCEYYNDWVNKANGRTRIIPKLVESINEYRFCRTSEKYLGPDIMDGGLVPNGAACGDGKMCLNQKCVAVNILLSPECATNCSNNGVCNSEGHCHCNAGFSPPDCSSAGHGGSVDSGPILDPYGLRWFKISLYVVFLVIVPLTSMTLLMIHCVMNKSSLWHQRHVLTQGSLFEKLLRSSSAETLARPRPPREGMPSTHSNIQRPNFPDVCPPGWMVFDSEASERSPVYENMKEIAKYAKPTIKRHAPNIPIEKVSHNDAAKVGPMNVKTLAQQFEISIEQSGNKPISSHRPTMPHVQNSRANQSLHTSSKITYR